MNKLRFHSSLDKKKKKKNEGIAFLHQQIKKMRTNCDFWPEAFLHSACKLKCNTARRFTFGGNSRQFLESMAKIIGECCGMQIHKFRLYFMRDALYYVY